MMNKKIFNLGMKSFIFLLLLFSISAGMNLFPIENSTTTNSTETVSKDENTGSADTSSDKEKNKETVFHYEMTVTATRTEKSTFEIPQPVSVINFQKFIEAAPNNISDVMVELPGVDVNGVGANQARPVIRGLRGQRILLMEDGIRMNNSRRQQNFGEIPALVDTSEIEKVELVRGPSSVLYGTDAIGGVINIITKAPTFDSRMNQVHGNVGYRYGSSDKQNKAFATINGNFGKLNFKISGNYRNAKDYKAPSGTFGNIKLTENTTVKDTGVKDGGANLLFSYFFTERSILTFKYEYYNANDSGFGFIEPSAYDPNSARIQIQYPFQTVQRYTAKYENKQLGFALADSMEFTGFYTTNERKLNMDIFASFGIPNRPTAGVNVVSNNFTDIGTLGFRMELNKAVKHQLFTYGFDFFQDDSKNTDVVMTQILGFGPPKPTYEYTPQVPNARYRSMGVFVQDDIPLFKRTSVILGVRYQNVNAKTKDTPNLTNTQLYSSTDQTLVGSANFIYGITEKLRLVFSVGRGFRSPNLIERFYNGVTPEGSGFQSRNTGLKAETSLNFDFGFKYRRTDFFCETTFFHNVIRDGIRLVATGKKVNGINEYQNINVDKLRMNGIEIYTGYSFKFGVSLMGNFTSIKSKDLGNPETPYTDTYSSKTNLNVRYDDPKKLFWLEYSMRINGKQKDIVLLDNPIGDIIPGFTVHNISAGITLFRNSSHPQRIGIIVGNITNKLYSEFSNASFFRPQPGRNIVLTYTSTF